VVVTVAGSRVVGSVRIAVVRGCQWWRLSGSGSVRIAVVRGRQRWRLCGRYYLLLLMLLIVQSYLQAH